MPLSLSKVQYVLFDWDGTLANNRDIVVFSLEKVLAEFGLPKWDEVKSKRDPRLSLWDNFYNIFGDKAKEAYGKYLQTYRQQIPSRLKSFPYAAETLQYCKEQGADLIIMTNKDRRLLDIELPILYDTSLFSRIVCAHEAPRDKPYPEHIYYALRGFLSPLEINTEKVWLIGDSNQDSDCAIAAGVLPIRVNEALFEDAGYKSGHICYYKGFKELLADLQKNK